MDEPTIERYRNQWVAATGEGQVVADAESFDQPISALEQLAITGATIQRVPAVDEPLFVGLSY